MQLLEFLCEVIFCAWSISRSCFTFCSISILMAANCLSISSDRPSIPWTAFLILPIRFSMGFSEALSFYFQTLHWLDRIGGLCAFWFYSCDKPIPCMSHSRALVLFQDTVSNSEWPSWVSSTPSLYPQTQPAEWLHASWSCPTLHEFSYMLHR